MASQTPKKTLIRSRSLLFQQSEVRKSCGMISQLDKSWHSGTSSLLWNTVGMKQKWVSRQHAWVLHERRQFWWHKDYIHLAVSQRGRWVTADICPVYVTVLQLSPEAWILGRALSFTGIGVQLRMKRLGLFLNTHIYKNVGVSHDQEQSFRAGDSHVVAFRIWQKAQHALKVTVL